MLTNKITHFKHLSNFPTLKQFNNNIEMHLADHKSHFTKKELIILKRLIRYSSKVYGVSNISIRRLIQSVELHDNTIVSPATFHRMKRKAVKYGLLEIHSSKRTDNSQSSNIYVFLLYASSKNIEESTNIDTPIKKQNKQEVTSYQHSQKREKTSHKTDNTKTSHILNKRKQNDKYDKQIFDSSFISENVPSKLVLAITPFFNTADEIYAIYKRLKQATKQAPHSIVTNLDDFVTTFKQTVYRLKSGHVKGDYLGYLYGAFKKKCESLQNRYVVDEDSVYFSWLKGLD